MRNHDLAISMLLIFCNISITVFAAVPEESNKYALLVGIADYRTDKLEGPINDVRSIRNALVSHWNFRTQDIRVLLNRQATKHKILDNIENLYRVSKPGDDIFIYLSGHGTSAGDKTASYPLPTTTGAFIPIDVDYIHNQKNIIDRLIVGKDDLRPLLEKLDHGNRQVLVAIDACYSGNTVRGSHSEYKLPSRFIPIEKFLLTRGLPETKEPIKTVHKVNIKKNENSIYPYTNIYYLSASGEYEPAQDIPASMLDIFPTIDAKPHGAFTDSLLRIMTKTLHADHNNNGKISYAELKKTLRMLMSERGFNHTPQGLPSLTEDHNKLSERTLFGLTMEQKTAPDTLQYGQPTILKTSLNQHSKSEEFSKDVKNTSTQIENGEKQTEKLKIRIDTNLSFLSLELNKENIFRMVDTEEDVFISRRNGRITLLSPTGDTLNSGEDIDKRNLKIVLRRQHWLKFNLNKRYPEDFSVEIDFQDNGVSGTLTEGRAVGFSLRSSQDAFMLLIDIDPNGIVNVIFPYNVNEIKKYPSNEIATLSNISHVSSPFGRDIVQLYAFDKLTDELQKLSGKSFSLDSDLMNTFEDLIYNPNLNKSRASLVFYTTQNL